MCKAHQKLKTGERERERERERETFVVMDLRKIPSTDGEYALQCSDGIASFLV